MVEEDPDQVEQFLTIPWNLVYDQSPGRYKDAFQKGQGVERWRPFWAIRYNLTSGRRVNPWRRISDWTDPRVVAVIDPKAREGLSTEERANLEDFLEEFAFEPIAALSPMGETNVQPVRTQVGSLDELNTALEAGYPRLLYWIGHAQPDYLLLGNEPISPADLRNLLRSHADRDHPEGMIAFLNACRTAEPGATDSFLHVLHRFGFTGAIVAERQTIDNFANRFGLKFLRGFLNDGKPLGMLLHELRIDEAPLGLLYGAHCPPDIHVRIGPKPALIPPEIHEAQSVTGHVLDASLVAQERRAEPPRLPDRPYPSLAYYDYRDRLLFTGRDADIVRFAATLDLPDTRILVLHGESGVGKSSILRAGVIPYLEEECVGYRFLRDAEGQVVIIQATKDPVGRLAVGLLEMTSRPLEYRTPTGDVRMIALRAILDETLGAATVAFLVSAATLSTGTSSADRGRFTISSLPLESHTITAIYGGNAEANDVELAALTEMVDKVSITTLATELNPLGVGQAVTLTTTISPTDANGIVTSLVGMRTEPDATAIRAALMADPGLLATLLGRLSAPLPHALVLVLDQVEELFTLAKTAEEIAARDQTLRLLQRVAEVRADVKVIASLRTEYYGRLLDHLRAGRGDLTGVRDDLLRDFSRGELIKAITRPTRELKYDFRYSEGVPETIADGVLALRTENQDSVLPLMQVICSRLFDLKAPDPPGDRVVTLFDLETIGGVPGGLLVFVEDALERSMCLGPEDSDAFKAIYISLYTRQADGTLTTWLARRVDLEERWYGTRPFGEVLDAAVALRLLREDNLRIEGETPQTYVRLGHDALAKIADAWNAEREQRERLEEAEREQRARLDRERRRRRVVTTSLAMVSSVCLLIFLLTSLLFIKNRQLADAIAKADQRAHMAEARRLAAQSLSAMKDSPQLAQLLASEAVQATRRHGEPAIAAAEMALRESLASTGGIGLGWHGKLVTGLASDTKGRLAAGDEDGVVRVWDLNRLDAKPTLLQSGEGEVVAVEMLPGERLAAGGEDGMVRIWGLNNPEAKPISFGKHEGPVLSLKHLSGGRLASGGTDGTLRIWDSTPPHIGVPLGQGSGFPIHMLEVTPDGRLAGRVGGKVHVWNPKTPDAAPSVFQSEGDQVSALKILHDGRIASGTDDGLVRIWDLDRPEATPIALRLQNGAVRSLIELPDGRLVACGDGGVVRICDPSAPLSLPAALPACGCPLRTLSVLPGGRLVAGGDDGVLRVWDLAQLAPGPTLLRGHGSAVVVSVALPDGRLVSGGADGMVRVWDLREASEPAVLHVSDGQIESLEVLPDGQLIGGGTNGVVLWERPLAGSPPSMLRGYSGRVLTQVVLPGNRLAVGTADNRVRIWDLGNPTAEPLVLRDSEASPQCLIVTREGRLVAGGGDGVVRIWDLAHLDFEPQRRAGHQGPVVALAEFPGGRLASGAGDDAVRVWDLNQPKAVPELLFGGVEKGREEGRALAEFPDGRLASGAGDGLVRIWDLSHRRTPATVLYGVQKPVKTLILGRGGRLVCAKDDDTIEVWDEGRPGKPTSTLRGGGGKIQVLRIGIAGCLFAGYDDGSIWMWDLERPGAEPVILHGREGAVLDLEFTPDRRLVTAGVKGPVRVWDLDLDRLLGLAAVRCGRNLTGEEWRRYFPEETPRKTFEHLPSEPPLQSPLSRPSDHETR